MKKTIVALFAAASMFAGAPVASIASTDLALACDGPVPEAWQRPGGFCDQNDFNRSLSAPSDTPGCTRLVTVASTDLEEAKRILLATGATTTCCDTAYYEYPQGEDHLIAAINPCTGECASVTDDMIGIDKDARDRVMLVAC